MSVSRRKFGRYILYSNLLIYALYVLTLNVYMTLIPAMASSILDDDRHCPIYLTEEQAQNETYVNIKKKVSKAEFVLAGSRFYLPVNWRVLVVVWCVFVSLSILYFGFEERKCRQIFHYLWCIYFCIVDVAAIVFNRPIYVHYFYMVYRRAGYPTLILGYQVCLPYSFYWRCSSYY